MTTENIEKRIKIIEKNDKRNSKIKSLIDFVQAKIKEIEDFSLRDSLEEKLTNACIR